ncbi:MAG: DUF6476 family protein [Hyphomicrobiaceae bacterium]
MMQSAPRTEQPLSRDRPTSTASDAPSAPPNLAFLKALVVGLGVLMGILMLVIVGRLVYLIAKPSTPPDVTRQITLPAAAANVDVTLSDSRIGIRYQVDGRDYLAVFDQRSGQQLGRFELRVGDVSPEQR